MQKHRLLNYFIKEYDGFNAKGLIDIIKEASVCVISTHGSYRSLDFDAPMFGVYNLDWYLDTDYFLDNLYDGYFNGTKCVLLSACSTAYPSTDQYGNPNSIADIIKRKGVQTVVGFKNDIALAFFNGVINPNYYDQLYNQIFLHELGAGSTVNEAAETAFSYVVCPDYNPKTDPDYGFASFRIVGNGSLVVKN